MYFVYHNDLFCVLVVIALSYHFIMFCLRHLLAKIAFTFGSSGLDMQTKITLGFK